MSSLPPPLSRPYPSHSSGPRPLPNDRANRFVSLAIRIGLLAGVMFLAGKCSLAFTDRPSFLGLATATGGASLGDASRVVIVLHGYGGDRNDMARLAPETIALGAPEYTSFVFAEGPFRSTAGLGRAWWVTTNPAERADSVRRVSELIDDIIAKTGIASDHVYITGFSQGAALAIEVALSRKDTLGGVVSLSPCRGPVAWASLASAHAPLRGAIVHGQSDSVCPFDGGKQLQQELATFGHDITFVPIQGGHRLSAEGETAIVTLLKY